MRARWLIAVAVALAALAITAASAHGQFQLGLEDYNYFNPSSAGAAFGVTRTADTHWIHVNAGWSLVAPAATQEPRGFRPADPADPRYNWTGLDKTVRSAARWHLQVLLTLSGAPTWAEGPHRPANPNIGAGAWDPNPGKFAQFARAAALRYDGRFSDPLHPGAKLPRVKYWEIWNEENLPIDLAAPNLVGEYRALLNAAYKAIKGVSSRSVVLIGGLAPVSYLPPLSVSPLRFATDLMCLQRVNTTFRRVGSCPQQAQFDILAHHPYSLAATPTKHAYRYDDVLIGDMGKLSALLHAADRLHTVLPRIRHQLWVTEWGWYTNPPNRVVGDSEPTAARYVAYSMYEMWHNGVQTVIWFSARDNPTASTLTNVLGGGLYRSSGRPKLTLRAFAFPVVASVSRARGFVWGRAPVSRRVLVVVERHTGHRWMRMAQIRTGSDGVFYVRFRATGNGLYRARVLGGAVSLPYDSTPIPPRRTHLFSSG
ncbi:MAG: hypothetical protein ACR2QA_08820 [Solirubrobacteraceae bacterium]